MLESAENHAAGTVRDRLLNAAEQVVARQGVAKVTLESVAREAGVSKGGLLYHFPSKAALIEAIVRRLLSRLHAEQNERSMQDQNSEGAFTRAYLNSRKEPLSPQEVPIHTALLAAAGTDPQYLDPVRQVFADWQQRIEADGIDPVTACVVRLAIDGLCLCRLLGLAVPQGELHEKIIDRLLAMTQAKA